MDFGLKGIAYQNLKNTGFKVFYLRRWLRDFSGRKKKLEISGFKQETFTFSPESKNF